jgi:hypothetical protein
MEKATVDTELVRPVRLEHSHHDDQHRLGRTVESRPSEPPPPTSRPPT